jgi:hypothetical protein
MGPETRFTPTLTLTLIRFTGSEGPRLCLETESRIAVI